MPDTFPQSLNGLTDRLTSRLPGKLAERGDRRPVVTVLRLHGVITPMPAPVARPTINLHNLETAVTKAFAHDRLSAVALAINSPGGAATQSALVAERIRALADEKNVPVLAFCEDVAASGGYWLACAGDEIHAHASSLVGSIGVVTKSFGLHGLLERFGVDRRVHHAGDHKVRLDPFQPEKEDDVQWLAGLQSELHEQFISWVRSRREDKLTGSDEDLFSGEVWTGAKAQQLGLVDGVGTLRQVVRQRYPDAHIIPVEPRKPVLARLGIGGGAAGTRAAGAGAESVLALAETLEHRMLWSRFGL